MSLHAEHHASTEPTAHEPAAAAHHDPGSARQLVARCGGDRARLRRLLGQLNGALRSAALRELHQLHGAAFVHALLADRPDLGQPPGEQPHGTHAPASSEQPHGTHAPASSEQPHGTHAPASSEQPHGTHAPASGGRSPASPAPIASPAGATASGAAAPTADPQPGATLQPGDQGPQVAQLQQQLTAAGYYHGNVGGHFGPQTEAALRRFQQDHGLADDGRATAATLDALRAAAPTVVTGTAGGPGGAEPPPAVTGASAAIAYGMSVLGAPYAAINPYRFGVVPWPGGAKVDIHGKLRGPFAAGTQVFDCSGFVTACWKHAGVDLLARQLATSAAVVNDHSYLISVTPAQLQPGDLIAHPGHIVMYIGNGQVIQSTPNGGVKISGASEQLGASGAVCRRVPG